MYELERDISTCSDESEVSDFDKNVFIPVRLEIK